MKTNLYISTTGKAAAESLNLIQESHRKAGITLISPIQHKGMSLPALDSLHYPAYLRQKWQFARVQSAARRPAHRPKIRFRAETGAKPHIFQRSGYSSAKTAP